MFHSIIFALAYFGSTVLWNLWDFSKSCDCRTSLILPWGRQPREHPSSSRCARMTSLIPFSFFSFVCRVSDERWFLQRTFNWFSFFPILCFSFFSYFYLMFFWFFRFFVSSCGSRPLRAACSDRPRRSKPWLFKRILDTKRYFSSPGRSGPLAPTGPGAQNRYFPKGF